MNNFKSIFVFASLLFFASCSKEALLDPTADVAAETVTEAYIAPMDSPQPAPQASGKSSEIAVTTDDQFQTPNELHIDFVSSHDFTGTVLENVQTIDFEDAGGNTVTLSFDVNTYTGGNGTLNVELAMGENDLSGLVIKDAQGIVVDDEIFN